MCTSATQTSDGVLVYVGRRQWKAWVASARKTARLMQLLVKERITVDSAKGCI